MEKENKIIYIDKLNKIFKKLKLNKEKILFLILTIIFAIPSIVYLSKYKTVNDFKSYFTYFLRIPTVITESTISGIIFFTIIFLLAILMFIITKKNEKIFKTINEIYIFILVVAFIFAIILPFTTSDIFYYMGTRKIRFKI